MLLALLPLGAIAAVATLWVVGRLVLKPRAGRVASFLVGWAIFRVLALIPVLGIIVWLAAVVFGLGVLALALRRKVARSAPAAVLSPARARLSLALSARAGPGGPARVPACWVFGQTPRGCGPRPRWNSSINLGTSISRRHR